MKNPRLFLAVSAKMEEYGQIQSDFKTLVSGKWTPPQQLHATIVFFGHAYDPDELLKLLEPLDLRTETSQISGLGYFARNRILYANTSNASLQRVHRDVTSTLGVAKKRFFPHITLMRVTKILDAPAFYNRLDSYQERPGGELSPRIGLFSSKLSHEGAHYTLLKEWV